MADFNMQSIECPNCKTEQTTKVWESIDVTGDEKRKMKVLNNEIFTFKCSKCGQMIPLVYNCLYTDDHRKLMVWVIPQISDEELEKMPIPAGIKDIEEGGKDAADYILRVVSNPNELREKIIINDQGLDDRIVELMKMIYLSQITNITGDESLANQRLMEMYLNITEDGQYCFTMFFENDKEYLIGADKAVYDGIYKDFIDIVNENTDKGFIKVNFEWSQKIFMLSKTA